MSQSSEINIRTAKEEDFYKIFEMITKLAHIERKEFSTTPEQLIKDAGLKSSDKALFECAVVELKYGNRCELIGYGTWYFGYTCWSGKIAYLEDLHLEERFRKKEIAIKLLSFVCKEVVRKGGSWLRFSVLKSNQNAAEFFEKLNAQDVTLIYDYHIYSFDNQSLRKMAKLDQLN